MVRDGWRSKLARGVLRLWLGMMVVVLLAGCGSGAVPTLVPISTPTAATSGGSGGGSNFGSGGVTASGMVVPAQQAELGFALTGLVQMVSVKVGDRVQAGQVLVQLKGRERAEADVAGAQQQVAAAQQESQAAQQELADAQKEVLDAQKAITDMVTSTAAALNLAQTQAAIADLQKQIEDASRSLGYLTAPNLKYYQDQVTQAQDTLTNAQQDATLVDISQLQVDLRNAQKQLETATNVYNNAKDGFAKCPSCEKVWAYDRMTNWEDAVNLFTDANNRVQQVQTQIDQSQRGSSLTVSAAQDNLDTAERQLSYYLKGPDATRLAQAQANVGLLQAQLAQAQSDAEKLAANNGIDQDKLKAAKDRVTTADQSVAAAQARIVTAQARLPAAQASLVAAQAALDGLSLMAPFTGDIVALDIGNGEIVLPGQVLVRMADLARLEVETTDLSEKDISQVSVGQSANIYVEALRSDVKGQVTRIATDATKLGGDVVYAVTLQLAEQPTGLRWGMSVKVDFASK
jgi:multidrug efflux pump subunit AcrA (membrane-fusion protein)